MEAILNNEFLKRLEFNRFGLTAIVITLQSCLGGIATCYLLQLENSQALPLMIVTVMLSMANNAFAIAELSMKTIFKTFVGAMVITTAILVYSLLVL